MSDEIKGSSFRFWITALGAIVPLLALLFTAWKYVDEVSRQNRIDEQARILEAQTDLFAAVRKGQPGPIQIFAVRQLRDSEEYCDTVIRVLSGMYCGLEDGRSPDQYQHLTNDGYDRSNLSIELSLSLSTLCSTCPEHPTTIGICQARESKKFTERCDY